MKNDEDAPCDVCRSKESEPSNEMVFCDICDVCVHQACYGVTEIPKGQWFCKPCEQNIRPKCIFCPSNKGAMKKTSEGSWAHVSCALWIPEVTFGDPEKMDNIVNTEKIPKSRWNLMCDLCPARMRDGACIQCYVKTCKTAYHVTCAFENKLYMEMEEVESNEEEIRFESLCLEHTRVRASGQNPHASTRPSRKRKKDQENLESNENQIDTRVNEITELLEEEDCAPTSDDTDIPVVSAVETKMEENGNNVENADNGSEIGTRLEQGIMNLTAISKRTARKSFALPPKKVTIPPIKVTIPPIKVTLPPKKVALPPKKATLSQILPKLNGKAVPKPKEQSNKSKRPSVQNGLPKPKKPRAKSSKPKTSPLHLNPPTPFPPHEKGTNRTQNDQSSSMKPEFSGTPPTLPYSNSSHSVDRQLFSTPNMQTSNSDQNQHQHQWSGSPQQRTNSSSINDMSPSNFQPFSTSQNGQQPLSDVANPTLSLMPKRDNLDDFSRYLTSILRTLPFRKSLRIQKNIISLVLKEHDVSSEDEFDVSSVSSDD